MRENKQLDQNQPKQLLLNLSPSEPKKAYIKDVIILSEVRKLKQASQTAISKSNPALLALLN